jgi:hypothetical protein
VLLPWRSAEQKTLVPGDHPLPVKDGRLRRIHRLCIDALFSPLAAAIEAVEGLGEDLRRADDRVANLIRRRLEALARHPDERIRCLAYRILLLDEPMPEYGRVFPTFVESGLTFLRESIMLAFDEEDLRAGAPSRDHR